jgi:hypothetical protein
MVDELDEILAIHQRVLFTDVSLGLKDYEVCHVCHAVWDEPEDWDESVDGDWDWPLVQQRYPCRTRVLIEAIKARTKR